MNFHLRILLLILLLFHSGVYSQDSLLTLQKAIEITLKNNYEIRIATNNSEQQANNNTAGNAGILPNVDLNGSYARSSNSLKQKYNTGAEVDRNGAGATNTVVDLGANWTVFDGLKMFNTKSKLSELTMLSRDQQKIQIENSLQDLITAYYSSVRQVQLLRSMKEELSLSEEREKIAERKMNNGSGSRLDWLQAKTDHNRQRSQEIILTSEVEASRIKLNQLLGRDVSTIFSVEDTVVITYKPLLEELKKKVNEQNSELSYYRRNQQIAKLGLKETKALRSPIVNINAHYVLSKANNDAGFLLLNQSHGYNYGATATLPLFHGSNISRQIKNSKLNILNSDISYESANAQVNADLYNAWITFSSDLELLQMEEQNIGYAHEILTVAQERYRVGVTNTVELQDAQRTFEESMTRLADARYNAKVSETMLRRLNGVLVK